MNHLSIPCPTCATPIPFDPALLISGQQFACPKCASMIGISRESIPLAKEAFEKQKQLKKQNT